MTSSSAEADLDDAFDAIAQARAARPEEEEDAEAADGADGDESARDAPGGAPDGARARVAFSDTTTGGAEEQL